MNALILAGSRGPDDPMARAAGVRHKTLLPIHGEPMLLRVARTLLEHPRVTNVHVSIEDEDVLRSAPALARLVEQGRLHRIATGASPAASCALAIEAIGVTQPLLITTGDHPLLSSAMIDGLLALSPEECDLAVAVVPAEIVAARYPGSIRTFYRLGSRRYSGCNLFLARRPKAALVARYWRRLEQFRKRPLRLILEVGPLALIGILLGLVDLEGACRILSRRTGAAIRPVMLQIPEAAIDVDKPEDWRLVEEILKRREGTR